MSQFVGGIFLYYVSIHFAIKAVYSPVFKFIHFLTQARDHDDPDSIHSKIGPVRIFMGNLNEGTTEEEVLQVVEPLGEVKKIDLKVILSCFLCRQEDLD